MIYKTTEKQNSHNNFITVQSAKNDTVASEVPSLTIRLSPTG